MADEDERDEIPEMGEEEEAWEEPAEVDGLPDGNTTTFVGGFSPVTSVAEALTRLKHRDDQIVVLPGTYETGVKLDATAHAGLRFLGSAVGYNAAEGPTTSAAVVFKGPLEIEYSIPEQKREEPAADDDDDGKPKGPGEPPRPLTIGHMTFLKGVVTKELAHARVHNVVFGERYVTATPGTPGAPGAATEEEPTWVQCRGLSTTVFEDCHVYGQRNSAVYCYPHSRVVFNGCVIEAAQRPPPPPPPEARGKKKKIVRPPTPPPAVPAEASECEVGVHCDDASAKFTGCTIRGFDIGACLNDVCKGTTFERCTVSEIYTVGFLLSNGASAAIRKNVVKLCGRETVVVGERCHPTLRDNILVGNARVARGAVATGICDNVLGLGGQAWNEEGQFVLKGFRTVDNDPSIVKPKKVVEDE